MAAPPMASPVTSPSAAGRAEPSSPQPQAPSSGLAPLPAAALAAAFPEPEGHAPNSVARAQTASSDDPFAMFHSEGAAADADAAAAALRDFCARPASAARTGAAAAAGQQQQQQARAQEGDRARRKDKHSSSRSSKEGRSRRSSSRHGGKETRIDAPVAAAPAALLFHPSGHLLAPPRPAPPASSYDPALQSRSATPSSGRSSASSHSEGDPGRARGGRVEVHSDDGSDSSSSESSSASPSPSPPPHRSHASRSEGQRRPPSEQEARYGGADYSGMSSESVSRVAHVLSSRRHEDHAPASRRLASPHASRYDAFGEMGGSVAARGSSRQERGPSLEQARHTLLLTDDLPRWLAAQSFDDSVATRLAAAGALDLPHVSRLSKASLKGLLGVAHGIRLHMAIREVEAAQAIVDAAAHDEQRGSRRHRSSRSGRSRSKHSTSSYLPRHTNARSPSPATLFRELHPPGLYGYCAVSDCDLSANAQCANKQCHATLCLYHAHKLLLTGQTLCESCYEQASYVESLKEATGINALQENGYINPPEQCVVQ